MALEGLGRVFGSLENTIVYAEVTVNVTNLRLNLQHFRIIRFSNIEVQLDQPRVIKELTGTILGPITSLFKDRITTSISDGLKGQMQSVINDFNNDDPLKLCEFAKKLVSGLPGNATNNLKFK
ncbi:uncharacterized protein LOC121530354 [Drosophila eugracilis]|uniref:uncharacterized protein LOC121530354 n=1 Tax=Drosophila eugracilis TaxID=29029 RepID=UPI001BDACEFC|nr:uncharacterized protein LOC121530354 [Drosophila eugracilis]XP_041675249.1 uncharacterized protein LOC121530354 [Drosophila eugracilis]